MWAPQCPSGGCSASIHQLQTAWHSESGNPGKLRPLGRHSCSLPFITQSYSMLLCGPGGGAGPGGDGGDARWISRPISASFSTTPGSEGKIHRVGPEFGPTLTASNRDYQSNCWADWKFMGQPCEFQVVADTIVPIFTDRDQRYIRCYYHSCC